MKTAEFFEKRLHAPLANYGWSWGAYDEAHNRLFLRVHWGNFSPDADDPTWAMLLHPRWDEGISPGYPERERHITMLQQGVPTFAVGYSTRKVGGKWKTKDFDRNMLFRLGDRIQTKSDDGKWVRVLERIPTEKVVDLEPDSNRIGNDIQQALEGSDPITEKLAEVLARIGQGSFRDRVLEEWDYRCSVTGTEVQEVIRASHIKPWSQSTPAERLDRFNGLPLIATLDALFDRGLITFQRDGKMLVSPELSPADRKGLLPRSRRLSRRPDPRTAKYLALHKLERFRK